ncbi:EF-hand calcium-binding domain-containing protein 5-like [Anastrepha obliqua]|uniref:EF-hand calcium-binding domain-containing protein 5-like n=1 Tax=Anastrepha obliqua TaxID=95512 RepID=UPI00240A5C31|nr:EF-hand calcium-binding domain-containing protein 5-like [Anastrepha obliqua]
MVSALLIFFTVTSNICDMQLCYERERYSYISYEINEVIQRSSLNKQCVINSTFMEVIAFDQEQLCDTQIEDDQCYAQPVEETAKEWTAKEGTAKKETTKVRTAKEGTGKEGTAKEETAKEGTGKEGTAKEETAKEGTAKEGTAKEWAAKEGTAKEGTAKEGTAKKETAKGETAKEEKLSKDDVGLVLILFLFIVALCSR